MAREIIGTSDAPGSGLFSQAVKVGSTVYVSGIVGIDPPLSLMGLADWLPIALSHSKCCSRSGFDQPGSYLFCHHCVISPEQSVVCSPLLPFLSVTQRIMRPCASAHSRL
jgi:hypothetical protein